MAINHYLPFEFLYYSYQFTNAACSIKTYRSHTSQNVRMVPDQVLNGHSIEVSSRGLDSTDASQWNSANFAINGLIHYSTCQKPNHPLKSNLLEKSTSLLHAIINSISKLLVSSISPFNCSHYLFPIIHGADSREQVARLPVKVILGGPTWPGRSIAPINARTGGFGVRRGLRWRLRGWTGQIPVFPWTLVSAVGGGVREAERGGEEGSRRRDEVARPEKGSDRIHFDFGGFGATAQVGRRTRKRKGFSLLVSI